MAVSRLIFLAKYRVPHACFSMQFDSYVKGIDRTIIATPLSRDELAPVWDRYNIDHSQFEYISDDVIYQHYPEVNHWVIEGDYRGWWLRQQAIKLAYLDYINDTVMLMNDPDTFMIEPYQCWDGQQLNYLVLENTTHGSYDQMLPGILNMPRQTTHCFITEFVPVLGKDMQALKTTLQHMYPDQLWLDAIINNTPGLPTVPPWGNGNLIKWFSEYEFLGNWAMTQHPVSFQFQRRFEYDSLEQLSNLTSEYNAVCDAVPDLSMSMQLDWSTLDIPNFDVYLKLVKARIQ